MFLSIVSLVECDGQVGGPRRDVAAVVLAVEVNESHAPVRQSASLVERGRTGDDVEDSTARIHQRVGRFKTAAPGRNVGGVVG